MPNVYYKIAAVLRKARHAYEPCNVFLCYKILAAALMSSPKCGVKNDKIQINV